MEKKNNLEVLFLEAEAYSHMDAVEQLLQQGMDLSQHPIQPLYACIKSLGAEVAGTYLDLFSSEQRQVMMDLDLWHRDDISPNYFSFWVSAFSNCPHEDIRLEFIKSEQFALWLKGRINIWTFDVEDPMYPDHDNYFLTDDSLLLIEFDEDFAFVDELRQFIRELYGELGVEKAYSYLFKIVTDSYSSLLEEEYRLKKSRMSDYGFVDYYDAISLVAPFQKIELVDAFIRKMAPTTGRIDELSQGQTLHYSALTAYKNQMDSFYLEMEKLTDDKRAKFINFDFIRLVNSTLTLDEAFQAGPVAMAKAGKKSRVLMLLGLSYVKYIIGDSLPEGVFSRFLYSDLYRIGNSLVLIGQRRIKKVMADSGFDQQNESFLGQYWNNFLERSFERPVQVSVGDEIDELVKADQLLIWQKEIEFFATALPYFKQISNVMSDIKEKGSVLSHFYLNYAVEDIDLEAILISQFARFLVGDHQLQSSKLGITPREVRDFFKTTVADDGKLRRDAAFNDHLKLFVEKIGMSELDGVLNYLRVILAANIEGYSIDDLADDDLKHIGGILVLDTLKQ